MPIIWKPCICELLATTVPDQRVWSNTRVSREWLIEMHVAYFVVRAGSLPEGTE